MQKTIIKITYMNEKAPDPQGSSLNFQPGANSYAPCNMESLINKFTNKYICFYNLINVKGVETKDSYLRETC